jgi:transposase
MGTRDRIVALHSQGLHNAEIAQSVGVSRQWVWRVLNPKGEKRRYDASAFLSAPKKVRIAPMSISSAATILGVHPNTIRRWADIGLIQCFRLGPRHDRRFEPQHVMEMVHPNNIAR